MMTQKSKTKYIFIVGNSRSGTTLMAQVLNNHSEVHIMRETHFYEEHIAGRHGAVSSDDKMNLINRMLSIQEFGIYKKNVLRDHPDEVNAVMSQLPSGGNNIFAVISRVFDLTARRNGKEIPGDQTPRHVFYLTDILKEFPGSKALIMVRDSRDVILSQKNKWKASQKKGQPGFEILRTRLNYHPVTASYIWNQGIKTSLKFKDDRYVQNVKFVVFEELISRPLETIREICNFLGINFEEQMSDVSLSMSSDMATGSQKVKGFVPSIAGKWRNGLSKTEAYLCQRITKRYLNYFGYTIEPIKPDYILLLAYLLTFFPRLALSICLNLNRMGNPLKFIIKRILITFQPVKETENKVSGPINHENRSGSKGSMFGGKELWT